MKKILLLLLMVTVLVGMGQTVEASEKRMEVLGNLNGVIEDLVVDSTKNPARLIYAEDSKIVFDGNEFDMYSDSNAYLIDVVTDPTIFYRVNENLVVAGNLPIISKIYSDSPNNFYMYPKMMMAYNLNDKLTLGGAFETNIDSYNDYKPSRLEFKGGFDYIVDDSLTLDGSMNFINSNINIEGTNIMNFYTRGVKDITDWYDIVAVADLEFSDMAKRQRFKLGQNFDVYDSLVAYGIEVENDILDSDDDETKINLKWGIEKEFNDKFTLRVGDSDRIIYINKTTDETSYGTPRFSPSIGGKYKISDSTSIDFSIGDTYFEKYTNDVSEFIINFALTKEF